VGVQIHVLWLWICDCCDLAIFGVIFASRLDFCPRIVLPRPFNFDTQIVAGVLVSKESGFPNGSEIRCSYVHRVLVALLERPISKKSMEQFVSNIARAQSLSESQQWCVN
jgi:hypothetical protein